MDREPKRCGGARERIGVLGPRGGGSGPCGKVRAGRGRIPSTVMMKIVVVLHRRAPRVQISPRGGEPARVRPGHAHHSATPTTDLRSVAGPRVPHPSGHSFPSLGCARRDRVGAVGVVWGSPASLQDRPSEWLSCGVGGGRNAAGGRGQACCAPRRPPSGLARRAGRGPGRLGPLGPRPITLSTTCDSRRAAEVTPPLARLPAASLRPRPPWGRGPGQPRPVVPPRGPARAAPTAGSSLHNGARRHGPGPPPPPGRSPGLSRPAGATAAAAELPRRQPGGASSRNCQALAAEMMRRWPSSEPGFPA